jgi:deoxyribodipyrimidine photo-lyase
LQDMQSPSVKLEFKPLSKLIQRGDTGLPCMDDFISSLQTHGYLHNHARMWLAAYIVHWLKNDWQLAADWMHDLLIDGDYASNHLSWQWVASTFSHKPYFFNQENLAKYTNQQYCNSCQAPCPFKDSYANLDQKLFQSSQQTARQYEPFKPIKQQAVIVGNQTVIWVHDEMLNATHPLMKRPEEKVFIFDPHYYKNWSMLRLQFIADCLVEMPDVSVWVGDTQTVLKQLNVQKILTQATPNDHLQQQVLGFSTHWYEEEMVCEKTIKPDDLKSFSKFWKKASKSFIGT